VLVLVAVVTTAGALPLCKPALPERLERERAAAAAGQDAEPATAGSVGSGDSGSATVFRQKT